MTLLGESAGGLRQTAQLLAAFAGGPKMSLTVGTLEHHDGSADSIRSFRATAQLLEPIGSDTFVEFAVNGTTILARVAPDMPFEVGRTVQVEVTPSRLQPFDRTEGERIIG